MIYPFWLLKWPLIWPFGFCEPALMQTFCGLKKEFACVQQIWQFKTKLWPFFLSTLDHTDLSTKTERWA